MSWVRAALLLAVTFSMITGCAHPLAISGEGDIRSLSGDRDCLLEDFQAGAVNCVNNYVIGAYDETYMADPRPGWVFHGWRTYCDNNMSNECTFSLPALKVYENWGERLPPLRAEFVEECTGPDCIEYLAPILGAVTDTSIKIWQATKSDAILKVRYRAGAGQWSESSVPINAASGFVGTVVLTGLQPDTSYEYETFLNDVSRFTSTFSTLPPAGHTGQIRFGMGSDFRNFEHPFLTLGHAATKNFDFMLMIGDLVYADHLAYGDNSIDHYTAKYWNTWDEPNFAALSTTTPMFMMWDDHEIKNDFWPGRYPIDLYPVARTVYDRYQGAHNPDTSGGVIYYSFSAPGADFFVLDTRSYRDPATDVDDINKSMLGDVQRNALLDYLQSSTAAFKFIVTSVPFSLGEVADDTWSNYRTERELILSEIESRGISNVAFLSGDRHWSGVFRIISPGGYVYYDFLPSPSGTEQRTAPTVNNHPGEEDLIFTFDTAKMIGDYQIDLSGVTPTLRAAFVDDNGVDQCVIIIGNDETGVLAGLPPATCQ